MAEREPKQQHDPEPTPQPEVGEYRERLITSPPVGQHHDMVMRFSGCDASTEKVWSEQEANVLSLRLSEAMWSMEDYIRLCNGIYDVYAEVVPLFEQTGSMTQQELELQKREAAYMKGLAAGVAGALHILYASIHPDKPAPYGMPLDEVQSKPGLHFVFKESAIFESDSIKW